MKHSFFFKLKSISLYYFIALFSISVFNLNAQGTAKPYNGLGPTLIIASNLEHVNTEVNHYDFSKLGIFNTTNYTLVRVGKDTDGPWNGDNSGHTEFEFLNEAIDLYLRWNYRRIIILEGGLCCK